ncbi:MAG: nucleotidyl transferase AbiEii/AbiGii toxin family protein [Holophagaceae bacterium]|nr:nucleotidyl transferase AbiEii/AbiGii toxin family protein [Holophagaceae bacterium]
MKDWIKNKSKQTGTPPNVLLQTYMMERLVERVSISHYRNNLILKGGFLIASMVGIDRRTTKDLDATAKGLSITQDGLKVILGEIISLDADDGATFEIQDIKNIHDISEYDDFRVSNLFGYAVHLIHTVIGVSSWLQQRQCNPSLPRL